MTQAWITDLLVAVVRGLGVVAVIVFAGGPVWAVGAFFYLVYITSPTRAQDRVRATR